MSQQLTFKHKIQKVKPMKMGKHEFLINPKLGYYPYYSVMLRQRVKQKKIVNNVVTGEGGVGKTYFGNPARPIWRKK